MKECRQCKRNFDECPTVLEYGKDDELYFCCKRCMRDWVDGLPEGSLIAKRVERETEITPWCEKGYEQVID